MIAIGSLCHGSQFNGIVWYVPDQTFGWPVTYPSSLRTVLERSAAPSA
jgi:hypothetical protein